MLPGRVFALPLSIYSLVHKSTRRTWELPPEPVPALVLRNPSKSPALLFLPVAAIAGCRPAGGAAGGSNHKGWNSSQPSIRGSSTQLRPPLSLGAATGGSTPDNPASLSRLSMLLPRIIPSRVATNHQEVLCYRRCGPEKTLPCRLSTGSTRTGHVPHKKGDNHLDMAPPGQPSTATGWKTAPGPT